MARFDEPVNPVDIVVVAVIRILLGLAGVFVDAAYLFVKDDAVGKGAAARGYDGAIVF